MFIEDDVKLDFKDVLIKPKRSTLESRKNVDLTREFTFLHSMKTFTGIPIVAANMDGVGTLDMNRSLNQHEMCTALTKHLDPHDIIFHLQDELCEDMTFVSIGIFPSDVERFRTIHQTFKNVSVCIDVANGYSQRFASFVKEFREEFPNTTIMAGNVVTSDMTEQLILSGADIVKIGIGPGCQTADTRILMSNGSYKDIVDVKPGDRIITMNGTPATVKNAFCTGQRNVRDIRTAHFYKPLTQTSDHKCFVGDLSSVKQETIQSHGYKRVLECPTRNGESKLSWTETRELDRHVGLLPNHIEWELPQSFEYDISEFFLRHEHKVNYNMTITSTYDLGFMFGFFLGDGNARKYKGTNTNGFSSFSGGVEWYINSRDQDRVEKLRSAIERVVGKDPIVATKKNKPSVTTVTLYSKQWGELLLSFGKFNKKHLPEKYWCLDKDYIRGLYEGLVSSDGYVTQDGQVNFYNTSPQLIELYGWLNYELYGSFPNVLNTGKQSSYLVEHPQHCGYRSFLANSHEKRQLDDYQIVKILDVSEEHEDAVLVYDLEIDDDTHSFIANNMIVHNSVCTTRKQTGVGYPQLSAIIECADAAHGLGGHVCADGGCTVPGDIAKAFGAGADFVMLGGMLAGHDQGGGTLFEYSKEHQSCFICGGSSDGQVINIDQALLEGKDSGNYKLFYGMSSSVAMNKHNGGVAEYRSSEGKQVLVPYRGDVHDTVKDILGGIRSACTYVGARKLKELSKRTTFVRVTQQINNVFGK